MAFGIAKEILGGATAGMTVTDDLSVKDVKETLAQKFPRLKELTSFMIAVNGEYAFPENTIKPDDEIAIIPPVSGG